MSFRPTPVRVFGRSLVSQAPRIGNPYVYRGDIPLAKDPDIATPRPTRSTAKCGTPAGYKKHVREQTAKCQACKDAHNSKQQARRAAA